jgi:heterotetrameric sarcosine oxidase gamma subunit
MPGSPSTWPMSTRKGSGCVSENSVSVVAIARSPITPAAPVRVVAGWEVSGSRGDAALTITDCTPLAKVHVRAPWNGALAKTLGVPFGRAARDAGELLIGSGPGEWLVLAPPGTAAAVAGRLEGIAVDSAPEEFVSVIDLTHGRALVRVTGDRAADLLARLCPADLHDDMTPDGTAFRSPVAGVATDVVRDDRDGTVSYLLHCERSSGQYLFDALAGAGEPFGIGVAGFQLPGI